MSPLPQQSLNNFFNTLLNIDNIHKLRLLTFYHVIIISLLKNFEQKKNSKIKSDIHLL